MPENLPLLKINNQKAFGENEKYTIYFNLFITGV